MKVQVLSTPGCSNCIILDKMLEQLSIKYELIDVTKKPEYLEKYPIFMAPGLVIDGKLEFTGIPKKPDLEKTSIVLLMFFTLDVMIFSNG